MLGAILRPSSRVSSLAMFAAIRRAKDGLCQIASSHSPRLTAAQ